MSRELPSPLPGHAGARFDARSGIFFGLALLILTAGFAQTLHRLTLPSDGWSLAVEGPAGDTRWVFEEKLTPGPSPIRAGDRLLAVEGQPVESIFARALVLEQRPPANWVVGRSVLYTVMREEEEVARSVRLTPRPVSLLLRQGWQLLHPSLFIGWIVFWLRPRNPAAQLLLIFGTCFYTSASIVQSVPVGVAEAMHPGVHWPTVLFYWPMFVAVIFPVGAHLFLTFPVLKLPMRRWPKLTLGLVYGLMPAVALGVLPFTHRRPHAYLPLLESVAFPVVFIFVAIVVASMVHSLITVRAPGQREQVRWVALGVLVSVVGGPATYGTGRPFFDALNQMFNLALPLSLGIAILRYRLFDIDVILRRTLVYTVLSALLVVVYLISIVFLQQVFRAVTGQQSELAVVISTLSIAALFGPLRRRVQDVVDRRFYRLKYDATRILAGFGMTLRDEVDLNVLSARLLAVVEETLQPVHASVWLRPSARGRGERRDT